MNRVLRSLPFAVAGIVGLCSIWSHVAWMQFGGWTDFVELMGMLSAALMLPAALWTSASRKRAANVTVAVLASIVLIAAATQAFTHPRHVGLSWITPVVLSLAVIALSLRRAPVG